VSNQAPTPSGWFSGPPFHPGPFFGYNYERSRFIQKANALFDPKEKALSGTFLPWPLGHPSLFGGFDPKTDSRIRTSLGYDSGNIKSNGMALIIHRSDGTFFVHAL